MLHSLPSELQDRRTGKSIGVGHKVGRNFYLRSLPIHDDREVEASSKVGVGAHLGEGNLSSNYYSAFQNFGFYSTQLDSVNKWNLWHSRLGHPHTARLKFMIKHHVLPVHLDLKYIDDSIHVCTHCIGAKAHKL
ncbi:hypothetical protein LINPERHAP1_LOCUS31316, partial [Linum perenne]